jgi:peptidyl-prolyl cis-trans isomerase SurA
MKTRTLSFFCFISMSTLIGSFVRAEQVNRIVATVDGEPITLHELRVFSQFAGERGMMTAPGGTAGMSDRDLLEGLIMNKLVDKEVETQGLKAKDSDIDSYIARIQAQGNMTDEQFQAALAKQGMPMEEYRKQVSKEIERALLINREIGSRVNVTPQDVERYYKEHSGDFSQSEQVRVRHLFLPLSPEATPAEEQEVGKLVDDIRKRALAGEDFATLANTYSQGPGAGQGGDLGYFKKGQMTKEIEDVAFALKAGDISDPFRTAAGVHLIKVEEHTSAGQMKLDEATTEEIKRKLYNEALRQRYERWFQEDLRFRHHVENFLTASTSGSPTPVARPTSTVAKASTDDTATSSDSAESDKKSGFFMKRLFRRLLPF